MTPKFYAVKPGWATQFYCATAVGGLPEGFSYGMSGFRGVVRAAIIEGGRPGDLLRITAPLYLVTDRVIEVLHENGFQRYETYSAEVSGGKGPLPHYNGLTFLGKAGRILAEASGVVYGDLHVDGSRSVLGMRNLTFDINDWDGSDLFYVDDFPALHLVTDRVVRAYKRAKITNVGFTPLEQYTWGLKR
jgi:hypothetical protein